MHSLRRTATRASLTRAVFTATSAAPKTQSIAFALRSLNAVRCFSVVAPRAFSSSAIFHEEQQERTQEVERRQPATDHCIFVQNYPFELSRQDLVDAFAKFGEVVHIHMPVKKSFCFIYYRTAEEATAAVENVDGTFWHGRRIVVKVSTPKPPGERSPRNTNTKERYDGPPTNTIFIGNLSFDATDADLNQLFGVFQNIKDIRVAVDKSTGWPRGFAHAEFETVEDATKGLEAVNGVELRGRKVVANYAPENPANKKDRQADGEAVQ